MKALLITYNNDSLVDVQTCEINANHDFTQGPYVDTVPFSVGSNQSVVEYDAHYYRKLLLKLGRKNEADELLMKLFPLTSPT